ncbi:MAG TPA: GspMb/PilO family protein [Albitalea sp.]|uniref:GspMb/PilO family protein n=1 Tax=Piscinibacter sp. TaxID=1903157 RepID=UPI002ED1146B
MAGDQVPWHWRVERAWTHASTQWSAWVLGAILLLSALGALVLAADHAMRTRLALDAQLAQAHAATPTRSADAPVEQPDFTQSLGPATPPAMVVQELQRACAQAGVVLASLQMQERAASAEQLGRSDFAITLRGAYPAIKQVIKQVVERFPSLAVQRMRMRRAQGPADIESSVTLSLWSAPFAASSPR